MNTPLQTLATSGVPLLLTGQHALLAHGCPREVADNECECAISGENEPLLGDHFARNQWNVVYRTPFFAKFRLLSTGTPVIKVLFLDATTFGQLRAASTEHTFDTITMRVPSLIHVIAMKLQCIKHELDRETEEMSEVLTLLRVNLAHWKPADLEAACKRFGPPGIHARIEQQLAS
ncbi:MAG: hypothetical protein ABIZ56_04975 [Chthoniobacteraceae bacterium]